MRGEIPKAVASLREGQSVTTEELLKHCHDEIGRENSPQFAEIIDEMPMTATGKIGRAQLQEREKKLAEE